jgi:hypothetical protein
MLQFQIEKLIHTTVDKSRQTHLLMGKKEQIKKTQYSLKRNRMKSVLHLNIPHENSLDASHRILWFEV